MYADNLVKILQGVRQPILALGELEAKAFDGCIAAIQEWSERPDAAMWYAVSWAEGRRAGAEGQRPWLAAFSVDFRGNFVTLEG